MKTPLPRFIRLWRLPLKMPTYKGKEITLRHLATHTSGLPLVPDNLDPQAR